MRTLLSIVAVFSMASFVQAADSPATVENPRCEYRVDPLGIDVVQPRLSWEMNDSRRGARQTAYQILVAGTPEKLAADQGDLWDSGKIDSHQSTQIVYAGRPLESRMRCYWKVRVWDADGNPSAYSKPALWTMGLLKPGEFQAKWIGVDGPMTYPVAKKVVEKPFDFDGCDWVWSLEPGVKAIDKAPQGTRYFRGVVTIPEGRTIRRARFLLTADDQCELFINGRSVGRSDRWESVQTVNVAKQLIAGKNCLAVAATNTSPSPAGLIGKLMVEFDEGEPLVAKIDTSWKAATKKSPKWNTAEFDDAKWTAAAKVCTRGEGPWGNISREPRKTEIYACPLFRKEFATHGGIRRATLYGSAMGSYRLYLNGRPVGNDYFTPDWTDYHKRIYYNTYDVTDMIKSDGPNAIGGVLAAGWYAGAVGFGGGRCHYGKQPWLFAQLEIELADGTIQTVATDDSWKWTFGPYVEGEFLAGETYDATREIHGWTSPGLDDAGWKSAALAKPISAKLEAFPGVTIRETGELHPVKITEPKPGAYVFDMGQNFAGFARLKVRGPAGTKVVMRFAEVLNPDGTIYTTNLRSARCIDTYILRGDGEEEIWQPRFTFHGFRYVEVTGYSGVPTKDAITGIAVNSSIPLVGSFECSSPMVNKLYQNIVWTQRANFISVPTDCPQRDERLGWTGDAETFVRAGTYNADIAAFYTKWLVDLEDAQGPTGDFPDVAPRIVDPSGGVAAWADAGTICPWTIYRVYNDKRLLDKHYAAMTRWVEFCRKNSTNLLRPAAGFGDWLSINASTPTDVIATAYFAQSTKLTAEAARRLGKTEDAKKYDELFEQIKAAFQKAYVAPDGRVKGNTQTCYVLALAFDLMPKDQREAAARYLVDDIKSRDTRLSTGFVGTSLLMTTLSATGNTPTAYKLLLNETFPSWGFSIKHGATSIWERWDGWTPERGFQDPGMNSFAHYSFGAVAQWMFQVVAGIDTAEPGFQKLLIRPQPAEGLTWVKAAYHSIHGRIATEWKIEGERLSVSVVIPANTTAVVCLPAADPASVTEGGRPASESEGVKSLGATAGESRFEVGAGEYRFAMPWTK